MVSAARSEAERSIETRPPMPWFALREITVLPPMPPH